MRNLPKKFWEWGPRSPENPNDQTLSSQTARLQYYVVPEMNGCRRRSLADGRSYLLRRKQTARKSAAAFDTFRDTSLMGGFSVAILKMAATPSNSCHGGLPLSISTTVHPRLLDSQQITYRLSEPTEAITSSKHSAFWTLMVRQQDCFYTERDRSTNLLFHGLSQQEVIVLMCYIKGHYI